MGARTHGTLSKWNYDRGFGFITPAQGTAEIFVHVSSFPSGGPRPTVGELISFETQAGPDGKVRAIRVMRPGSAARSTPRHRPAPARVRISLTGVLTAGANAAIAMSDTESLFIAALVARRKCRCHAGRPRRRVAGGRAVQVRRSHHVLADDFVRGGEVLPAALPEHTDGRERRRPALRAAMV